MCFGPGTNQKYMEDIGTLCVTRPFRIWVLIVQFLVIAVFSTSTRYYDILQLFSRVCVGPGTNHTYMKGIGMLFQDLGSDRPVLGHYSTFKINSI